MYQLSIPRRRHKREELNTSNGATFALRVVRTLIVWKPESKGPVALYEAKLTVNFLNFVLVFSFQLVLLHITREGVNAVWLK